MVVDPTSASPQLPGVTYYGIEATHSGMCKFESANAPGFRTLSTAIREWITEAPGVIQVRWLVELDDREVRHKLEFHERRLRQLVSRFPREPNEDEHMLIYEQNNQPPNTEIQMTGMSSTSIARRVPGLSSRRGNHRVEVEVEDLDDRTR